MFYFRIALAALLLGFAGMPAEAEVLFQRRSWSSTQKSIEAVFHVSIQAEGQAELSARWLARDGLPLSLREYRILDANGQVIKKSAEADSVFKGDFPFGMDFMSNASDSRSAETADWSTKNHSYMESSDGVGWNIALGKDPEPSPDSPNRAALAAVVETMEFSIPREDAALQGYKLECLMDRGAKGPLVLVYVLGEEPSAPEPRPTVIPESPKNLSPVIPPRRIRITVKGEPAPQIQS